MADWPAYLVLGGVALVAAAVLGGVFAAGWVARGARADARLDEAERQALTVFSYARPHLPGEVLELLEQELRPQHTGGRHRDH